MDVEKPEDLVNVAIRIRPNTEDATRSCLQLLSSNPPVLHVPEKMQSFSFDNVFEEKSGQSEVYEEMVQPLMERVLEGYNSTVFAYGQTGTGKTYTIGTDPLKYGDKDSGLITRTLFDILNQTNENIMVAVQVSFMEIYNEKVYDLLNSDSLALPMKGFNVVGLKKYKVANIHEASELLKVGGKNRHTAGTKQNSNSSRSHAIFTIYCNVKHYNHETESKLNLVDLAGSESIKRTGNEGNQLHEGININKGLLCVGQVINALSSNQSYIPYRQSTITMILQDSLNKKNFVTLIACVSPCIDDTHETVQTLEFAQRAKRVKSRPEVNNIVSQYKKNEYKCRATPKSNLTNSNRKQTYFKTPSKAFSTTALPNFGLAKPLHSTLLSDLGDCATPFHNFSLATPICHQPHVNEGNLNLTPIVKRCIDAVENNILQKIENVVKNSFIVPEKRNSPRIGWESFRNQVTRIVRDEFNELAKQNDFSIYRENTCRTLNSNLSLSFEGNENRSPIQHSQFPRASSPICCSPTEKSPTFKMPELPMGRKKVRKSTMKTSSPISNPRRSMRLSMRVATPSVNTPAPPPRKNKRKVKAYTPDSPKRVIKKTAGAKHKENTERVLKIINSGSLTELVKLNTIGMKTASMLQSFRQFKGKIHKISELEEVPWRGNAYIRFLQTNFLSD